MNLPRVILLLASVACFAIAFLELRPAQPLQWSAANVKNTQHRQPTVASDASEQDAEPADVRKKEQPFYSTAFISDGSTRLVHAAALAQQKDQLLAVWFGGSREGAGDVKLYMDQQALGSQSWGADWIAMTRERTAQDQSRYIKKLGNAVLTPNADGSLSMFYVSVSLGGWATSAINHSVSYNGGRDFERSKRLVSSPFFNLSTLVKGTPLHYVDGSIALPVYHELAGKFGELMHITPDGTTLDKSRITSQRYSLQPVLFATDSGTTALLRYCGKTTPRRVITAQSPDQGKTWKASGKTALPNPNSALSGLVLDSGDFLLALNDTEHSRHRLGLFLTNDQGKSFRVLHYFEDMSAEGKDLPKQQYIGKLSESLTQQGIAGSEVERLVAHAAETMCNVQRGTCNFQFDYPYLIQTSDNVFHIAYTWNKSFIKYVTFNRAWLEQRL